MAGNIKPFIVASAHKVGSTWLTYMLRTYFACQSKDIPEEFRANKINPSLIDLNAVGVSEFLRSIEDIQVLKSHSHPPDADVDIWDVAEFFYIYRDPRDIAVSNAYYLANLAPELGGKASFKDISTEERIMSYLEGITPDLRLLEGWFTNVHATKLSYETLLDSPTKCFAGIIEAKGFNVDPDALENAIAQSSFRRMSGGRSPGEEDNNSVFRKGIAGDWVDYFSPSLKEYFKTTQSGRWNRLLIDYGYETNTNW